MKRNDFIDFIKGMCMIFVIITHSSFTIQQRRNYLFPFWIDMAVPILMIVSGYVCSLSIKSKNSYCSLEIITPSYIIKRSLRLTIPFSIAFMVEWIMLQRNNKFGLMHLAKIFLHGGVGMGSYYYPIMMQFIFVFPLIFCIVKKMEGERYNSMFCYKFNI